MQVQKDTIRNKIIEAATEEFLTAGYKESSMRNIANQAGITVGNVYAYFSSKENLFENIIEPVLAKINELVSIRIEEENKLTPLTVSQITDAIVDTFLKHKMEFIILMNGSAGSKYENVKENLLSIISRRIKEELFSDVGEKVNDTLLADAISAAILDGFFTIFNKYGGDKERLKHLTKEFLYIVLGDIENRI